MLLRIRPELVFALLIVGALATLQTAAKEQPRPLNDSTISVEDDVEAPPHRALVPTSTPNDQKGKASLPIEASAPTTVRSPPIDVEEQTQLQPSALANTWDGESRYNVFFTTNQHGQPESTCTRPLCRALLSEITPLNSRCMGSVINPPSFRH